jgi:hypothetical protein
LILVARDLARGLPRESGRELARKSARELATKLATELAKMDSSKKKVGKIQLLSFRAICFWKRTARSGADGSLHLRRAQCGIAVFKKLQED